MKKLLLSLSTGLCCAFGVFAQTPYDNFAPEQGIKSIIELPGTQFKVANTDPVGEVRRIEFDKNTLSLNLLNDNDSVLKTITLNPDDKKFLTMDPLAEKYYSISPYAYCANNPVRYVDLRGDSITTVVTSTTNGVTTNTTYYYGQDAKGNYGFLDSSGKLYSGGDQFVASLTTALGNLRGGAKGQALVSDLMGSTNIVQIGQPRGSQTNSADPKGTYILWDPSSTNGGPDQKGNTARPSYIGLGHEMAHIQDVWNGTYDASTWATVGQKAIPNAEKYATHVENQLRSEQGLSLRTHYSPGYNSTRILQPRTNASLFYKRTVNLGGALIPTTPYIY